MNRIKTKLLFVILIISSTLLFAQESGWKAKWIGIPHSKKDTNIWVCYRKQFKLTEVPVSAMTKIGTDSKYWLWINDKMVVFEGELRRGPNPNDTYYDELDIAKYLKKGINEIGLLEWYWGRDGYNHKSSGKAALIFESFVGGKVIKSDSSWKAIRHPSFGNTPPPLPNYRLPEFNICFDAGKDIGNWQSIDYNDKEWLTPAEYGFPPIKPWNNLVIRPIPFWKNSGIISYKNIKISSDNSGNQIVKAQLPLNITITPYLKIDAPAGLRIDIRTDNYKGGSEYNVRTEYITKNGVQEFETFGYQNGHEVIYSFPKGVRIIDVKYRETRYNSELKGAFLCNDSFYNKLWQKSYNTLNVNMRDAIQDPDRERSQWWGDAVILLGQIFYTLDSNGTKAIQKAIRNLVDWQRSDGSLYSPVPSGSWDRELPTQMLASVGKYGFWKYYQYTADTSLIKYVYPAVKKYLSLWQFGEDGLVIHRPGGWDWLDWGVDIDAALIENSWYYMALDAAKEMALLTGNFNDTTAYRIKMQSIKENYNKKFWNGKAYRTPGNKGVTDDRGNALAIIAGIADSTKYDALKKIFQTEFHASPYIEKYIMESFFVMHDAKGGLDRMKKKYSKMVESDLSTLWEGWGIGKEGYGGGSYNHGWSGGSLTLLSQYVAGIEPDKPGYESFKIMPQLGGLNEVHCTAPTPKGNIHVDISQSGNKFTLKINVLNNTEAIIGIPKDNIVQRHIKANNKLIYDDYIIVKQINGIKYAGENENYYLFNVQKGGWVFTAE